MERAFDAAVADLAQREAAQQQEMTASLNAFGANIPSFLKGINSPSGAMNATSPKEPVVSLQSRDGKVNENHAIPKPPTSTRVEVYWQLNQYLFPLKIRDEILNGLNPNTSWTEDELVPLLPTSGCTVWGPSEDMAAWFHWNTPLHRAAWLGSLELVKFLLDAGADPNGTNAFGRTPLHEAICRHFEENIFSLLLDHGADIEILTTESQCGSRIKGHGEGGISPLHMAMSYSKGSKMQLLLDRGARHSPEGQWGVLELALLAEDRQMLAILLSRDVEFSADTFTKLEHWQGQRVDAKELLAVATSERMVPPAELHAVYHHAFSQVDMSPLENANGPDAALAIADRLIDGFFDHLRATAGIAMNPPPGSRCHRCSELQSQLRHSFEAVEYRHDMVFQLHDGRQQLEELASKGCQLCSLVADTLDEAERKIADSCHASTGVLQEHKGPNPDGPVFLKISPWTLHGLIVQWGQLQENVRLRYLNDDELPDLNIPENDMSTGSQSSFHTARKWLESCTTSPLHSECQRSTRQLQGSGQREYPTRLVDVGDRDSNPVLVEGVTGTIPYTALSYCWGPQSSAHLLTTRANIMKHMKEIPLDKFPATLRDAILTTRGLGIRYIWIDAVCIIQDNDQDWAHEASKMHAIYLNAEVTISSYTAGKASDSLFQPRSTRTSSPVPLKIWEKKSIRPPWRAGVIHRSGVLRDWLLKQDFNVEGPVHTRGWTLQQQLLSARTLYFGQGLIHWECPCAYRIEADPTDANYMSNSKGWNILRRRTEPRCVLRCFDAKGMNHINLPIPFKVWQQQLEAYALRELTNPSDRLAAFWAFSNYLGGLVPEKFLGGIWLGNHLLESLCWGYKSPSAGKPGSPTWTWVSTQGEVSFDHVARAATPDDFIPLARLVSHDASVDRLSFEVSGSITLNGSLYPAQLLDKPANKRILVSSHHFDHDVHAPFEDCYAFDILGFEYGPNFEGFGLPMYPKGLPPMKVFLLLEPEGNSRTRFRRVGLGKLSENPPPMARGKDRPKPMWIAEEDHFGQTITIV